MRLTAWLALFCSVTLPVCAAEYQSSQAAIAVIGQPNFSAQETGLNPTALSISNGRLYVADQSNRLFAYDISNLPAMGLSPVSVTNQPVVAGISAVSVNGKSVAIADTANHRVLFWNDVTSETALKGPDVVLADVSTLVDPISVAVDGQHLFVGDAALHRVFVWNSLPQANNQPPDVTLGEISDAPTASAINVPVALESDGQRLFVADSGFHRVLVFAPGDIPLKSASVLNTASEAAGPLAPGALITIAANGLAGVSQAAADDPAQPLPHQLGGVEVFLDGTSLPLLSVSPEEIRAQLPYDITDRSSASLFVRLEQNNSNAVAVTILPTAPGLFAFPGNEPRPGMAVADSAPVSSTTPAHPGQILTLWAAGLGPVRTASTDSITEAGIPNSQGDASVQIPVIATVNGAPAEVLSAALPAGSIGVYEVRIVLPPLNSTGTTATLVISQDGRTSNSVTIPVTNTVQ